MVFFSPFDAEYKSVYFALNVRSCRFANGEGKPNTACLSYIVPLDGGSITMLSFLAQRGALHFAFTRARIEGMSKTPGSYGTWRSAVNKHADGTYNMRGTSLLYVL
jgi:hypothetical protein